MGVTFGQPQDATNVIEGRDHDLDFFRVESFVPNER
jgi:hypothetical protein